MPIYIYECQSCHKTQEVRAKMSDPAPQACKYCQATNKMTKQIAQSSFHLQGGGWFANGYSTSSGSSGSSGE